jgi:hypothetical protein
MTITLEAIKAEQTKLAQMIANFEATAPTLFFIPEANIELQPGERYAGLILGDDGKPSHHLVLLPGDFEATWNDAKKLAEKAGGELPTRREQSLLFANLKDEFKAEWYWSGEQSSEDDAFLQSFGNGGQGISNKTYERRCRFVRRSVL